jgi:hypothetical protein
MQRTHYLAPLALKARFLTAPLLHDIDRTGWWVLIAVTAIGTLVLATGHACLARRVLTALDKSGSGCRTVARPGSNRDRYTRPGRDGAGRHGLRRLAEWRPRRDGGSVVHASS